MKRFMRFLKKTAKILLVFFVIVLTIRVVIGVLNFNWGRQVEARLATIKAAGQPVSIADMQGPLIPKNENAAPLYDQAIRLHQRYIAKREAKNNRAFSQIGSRTPAPADWIIAETEAAQYNNYFMLINKAQSKNACQFPMQINLYYHRLAGFREMARDLSTFMILKAHEGNTQEFVSYTKSALKLTDDLRDRYKFIEYFTRVAMIKITLANLNRALQYCQLSESQIKQLDTALSDIDSTAIYQQALEGERVFFLQSISKSGAKLPFGNGDTLAFLDTTAKYIEAVHMPYSVVLAKGFLKDNSNGNLPFYAIFTKMTVLMMKRACLTRYMMEADISCARVFLAIQSYKIKHSHYPENLSELKPGVEPNLLIDPFNGKDLIYKPTDKGFVLYSVGPNQKDDGGKKSHQNGKIRKQDDIAWEIDY